MDRFLAYDLGGSSFRLGLVTGAGTVEAMAQVPLEMRADAQGRIDVDPATWWQSLLAAAADLQAAGANLAGVRAVCGCGFTRTQVFLDAAGEPVHPAIPFHDARAAEALARHAASLDETGRAALAGVTAFHPLARLIWLRDTHPDLWRRVARVIEPKDYLSLRLTGRAVSDTISMAPLASAIGGGETGFDPALLPPLVQPFEAVGAVRRGLPGALAGLAGVPVICGSHDTWTAVLGTGALRAGAGYCISGTTDVTGILTRQPVQAPGLMGLQWGPDLWQLGGPSQGAAPRLRWMMRDVLGGAASEADLVAALAQTATPPVFLPYLEGERTPFWSPAMRGGFVGLGAGHGPADFIRAVAEGLNFLSRLVIERAEDARGAAVDAVAFSGGLARMPALAQLKADVLNRPVFVPESPETGLVGAALAACGDAATAEVLAAGVADTGRRFDPDPAQADALDARFRIFRKASAFLEDLARDAG